MRAFKSGEAGIGFFFLLLGFMPVIPAFINYATSEFGITDKRVLVKVGFIRRRSLEILLSKVGGVVLDQSILGMLLGYGTIVVNGTGGTEEPLDRIDEPLTFRKQLQEQIAVIQDQKRATEPP